MLFREIKLLLTGLAIILLGCASISLKFVLGEEAKLPFWPFDGIAAILGGAFVTWWTWTVMKERDEP
jgi:hypothetical protein